MAAEPASVSRGYGQIRQSPVHGRAIRRSPFAGRPGLHVPDAFFGFAAGHDVADGEDVDRSFAHAAHVGRTTVELENDVVAVEPRRAEAQARGTDVLAAGQGSGVHATAVAGGQLGAVAVRADAGGPHVVRREEQTQFAQHRPAVVALVEVHAQMFADVAHVDEGNERVLSLVDGVVGKEQYLAEALRVQRDRCGVDTGAGQGEAGHGRQYSSIHLRSSWCRGISGFAERCIVRDAHGVLRAIVASCALPCRGRRLAPWRCGQKQDPSGAGATPDGRQEAVDRCRNRPL